MELWLGEIAQAAKGKIYNNSYTVLVTSISTDTRNLRPGEVFLALRGEKYDGHDFIGEAIHKHCGGLIVQRIPDEAVPALNEAGEEIFVVKVNDTLKALGDIAQLWRERVKPTVIAVAGSSGKTTSKDLIAAVLSNCGDVLATPASWNNLIGVPLTLCQLQRSHKFAVIEMGMNEKGELERLTQIANPDVVVLTNIGNAHIGKLGSREELLQAKGELFQNLNGRCQVIFNQDCANSQQLLTRYNNINLQHSFGFSSDSGVRATDLELLKPYGYKFNLNIDQESTKARLQVFGRFNVYNALAAAAIGYMFNVPLSEIARVFDGFRPQQLRSQVEVVEGIYFIKDCYNASPDSMRDALKSIGDMEVEGRRYVLLSDMLELGRFADGFHKEVGRLLSEVGVDKVFTIGQLGRIIAESAGESGTPAYHFQSQQEAIDYLPELLSAGDLIFFKASRLMQLENAVEAIKAEITARKACLGDAVGQEGKR